jgi:hypothetical protein
VKYAFFDCEEQAGWRSSGRRGVETRARDDMYHGVDNLLRGSDIIPTTREIPLYALLRGR